MGIFNKLSLKNFKPYKIEYDRLSFARFLAVIIAISYIICGFIYKSYTPTNDPFAFRLRLIISLIFIMLYLLSYFNKMIKDNFYDIICFSSYMAIFQLLYMAFINNFSLNYSYSLIIVIIIANLIFQINNKIIWYNVTIVGLSIILLYSSNLDNNFLHIYTSAFSYLINMINYQTEKKLQENIRKNLKEQEMLLNTIDIQVWYMTDYTTYGKVNKAHADFMGKDKESLKHENIYDLFDEDIGNILIKNNKQIFTDRKQIELQEWIENKDGEQRLLNIKKIPKLNSDGTVEYIICQAEDITKQKKAKQQIEELSYQDNLTGLYNRKYFENMLRVYDQPEYFPLSIIVGDVNGLKLTNDAFGHNKGDKLLVKISKIIDSCCRENDIVSRWGGDEFVILLPYTSKENVKKVCQRINNEVNKVKPDPIKLSIALGYATKNRNNENINDIIEKAEAWMYKRKVNQSKEIHDKIISSLKDTFFNKTQESPEHCQRLKEMSLRLAQALKIENQQQTNLSLLAEYHDLGKVGVSDNILNKEEYLTNEDWDKIKRHPEIGYQITSSTPKLSNIADGILSHHEWWNGRGYPRGLKGKDIPLISRIIAVVDAYDIMTNGRSYKKPLSKREAVIELIKSKGTQFDPEIVDTFIQKVLKIDNQLLESISNDIKRKEI